MSNVIGNTMCIDSVTYSGFVFFFLLYFFFQAEDGIRDLVRSRGLGDVYKRQKNTNAGVCSYTVVGTEFDATFADNCSDGSITNDLNGTATIAGEVLPKGANTIVWTVNDGNGQTAVSYTHLRAHETVLDIVCRLLLEKKQAMLLSYTINMTRM